MYRFTHHADPERTAHLEPVEGKPAFVVHHTDANGKARKKTFKKGQAWQAYDAALRFLLNKEGYVLRAPQDGPVRWMARLRTDGYYGEIRHGISGDGTVWVADPVDRVHAITPGSGATTVRALGTGDPTPGVHVAGGEGRSAWLLIGGYDKVDGSLIPVSQLIRAVAEGDGIALHPVTETRGADVLRTVTTTETGLALGPSPEGAAVYAADGTVLQTFAVTPKTMPHGPALATGAISSNGEWMALTAPDHVRRIERATGEETALPADFKGVNSVQVSDTGEIFVSGFCYPSHGLYRLADGGQRRISEDIRATIRADGARVIEAAHRRVRVLDLTRPSTDEMQLSHVHAEAQLPVLGMAKYGCAKWVDADAVVVLTDAYTVAEVRLRGASSA
jgi:hypothetical protein